MKRKLFALVLALLLCQGLALPALAVVEEEATVRVDDVVAYSGEDGIYTVEDDGLYGFYWTDGTELAAPVYAAADVFHGGMAAVAPEESSGDSLLFGYVNTDGALAVSARYRRAFPFSEGRAFAVRARTGQLTLLDSSGEELAVFPGAELREDESIQFHEGLAVIPVREAGEETEGALVYLVVDREGREVCTLTDAWVDFEHGFHDGRLAAAEKGQWKEDGAARQFVPASGACGYRDDRGELVIPYQFDAAFPFSGGLAAVGSQAGHKSTLYGFIDTAGEAVIPAEYEDFLPYQDGAGAVMLDGKWAYMDEEGEPLTGFSYDSVSPLQEGSAMIRMGRRLRCVDADGRILFTADEEAVSALPFSGGVSALQAESGLWGISDEEGNMVVPFDYEAAFHWDGFLWLKRGNLWRVYRTEDVLTAREEAPEGTAAGVVGTFSDVPPDAYYAAAVTWAIDQDVVTGTGGGQFSPDRPCTTGEILTFLWRAMGRPEPSVENPFEDVSSNHYYYQAALWAYETGLVDGGIFGAAVPCTRSMAVTYLWLLAGGPVEEEAGFSDVPADAPYAQAVAWAVKAGITDGSGEGGFSPDSVCVRGQIVTFLFRYLQ